MVSVFLGSDLDLVHRQIGAPVFYPANTFGKRLLRRWFHPPHHFRMTLRIILLDGVAFLTTFISKKDVVLPIVCRDTTHQLVETVFCCNLGVGTETMTPMGETFSHYPLFQLFKKLSISFFFEPIQITLFFRSKKCSTSFVVVVLFTLIGSLVLLHILVAHCVRPQWV
jgi:hypothetical protein